MPEEFLRDPSYWMKASDMEIFLENAQRISQEEGPLFQKVGHAVPQLRSWGVLDSVLRMMPKPQEILAQPRRFLSYFISPEPPIENVVRTDNSIQFDIPVSSETYPLTTTYLRSAFESLPVYSGQASAQCSWDGIHLKLNWKSEQSTMFVEDVGHQISPELMRSVVAQLENHQKELEEKNRDLQDQNEKLAKAISQDSMSANVHDLEIIDSNSVQVIKNNLSKLSDYMVRAQQLMTMLVAQDRMNPAVKQAMKRTDWDLVRQQFPKIISECNQLLDQPKQKNSNSEESHHV